MTYRQAAGLAWQVRTGEKGTQIEFWEVKAGRDTKSQPVRDGDSDGHESADEHDDGRGDRLIHRVYTVFNAKQIEGIPEWTAKQQSAFEVVEAAEQILQNSGAIILHDQSDRAFYNRLADSIHLPAKNAFSDAAGYYGTALHELAHWSGHPSRLNRATLSESYRFGDISYAKEELRAELASVFLAAERGIPHDPEQHAAYVSSWISVLKQDKNEIFRAAHDASRAADFLLALERERSIAGEGLLPAALLQHSAEFGSVRSVAPEREASNSEPDRPDRKVGPVPSMSSPGKAPSRVMSGRSRTSGRGR